MNEKLSEAAHRVIDEDDDILKIVIVEHGAAAKINANLLTRALGFPKSDIASLGIVASDEENAQVLRQGKPIVIVPMNILANRPCEFYPLSGTQAVAIIDASGDEVRVANAECGEGPFQFQS